MNRLVAGFAVVVSCLLLTAPAGAQILPPGSMATQLASGYSFTEGPVYYDGGVYFSDTNNGNPSSYSAIIRYDVAAGTHSAVTGNSTGGANGMYLEDGMLLTADQIAKRISRRSFATPGTVDSTIATGLPNRDGVTPFNGPNDLVTDAIGGVYFTDPNWQGNTLPQSFYYVPTSGDPVPFAAAPFDKPNGIILSPDESTLYVGFWGSNTIRAWDVDGPGSLSNPRTFVSGATVPNPDGLTVDNQGNLYAAISGGVRAWDPAGQELFFLSVPGGATNVEIGGPTGQTLYITNGGGGGLYGVDLNLVPEPAVLTLLMAAAPVMALRRRR